jgi:H+-translocating NAD(P) transhydrogenase subunit beta
VPEVLASPLVASRLVASEGASAASLPTWAQLSYLLAAICFIVALRALSSPKTARVGNVVGAAGAVLACVITFVAYDMGGSVNLVLILLAVALGTVGGVVGARRVQMTQMPQLVALFNGVGGGAAALVALLELNELTAAPAGPGLVALVATAFTVLVGAVSFSGSLVTFAKLQELMTTRPVVFPGLPILFAGSLLAGVALSVVLVAAPTNLIGIVLCLVGLLLGVLLVLPVGGADVPIVISLLNAFTGLTVAAGGYVLGNTLLLVAGTLVGAAGTFLTKLMAQAMGRSLFNTLFGALKGGSTLGASEATDRPVRSAAAADIAILLGYAQRVIVVPGYGLAVAQAQHTLRDLVDELGARDINVDYAIHPVAGRMPGHMNVLLAEAQVPYEQLREMDEVNGEFKQADVVLVVGANDVVNPAAKTSPGAPIYGMPILNADQAGQIVFLKRSMRPGFAGIENELLFDPKTTLLFGDARDSLSKLLSAVKGL